MKMSTNKWQRNIEMTAVVCFSIKSKIYKFGRINNEDNS